MIRKSGKHLHAKHWTAVSTLLSLISSARRDRHHWRSNQQPQYAEAETLLLGHLFMPHISVAELTSYGVIYYKSYKYIYIYIYELYKRSNQTDVLYKESRKKNTNKSLEKRFINQLIPPTRFDRIV